MGSWLEARCVVPWTDLQTGRCETNEDARVIAFKSESRGCDVRRDLDMHGKGGTKTDPFYNQ